MFTTARGRGREVILCLVAGAILGSNCATRAEEEQPRQAIPPENLQVPLLDIKNAAVPEAQAASLPTAGCAAAAGPAVCGVDWSKVPPVRIVPRLGFFPILPSGPGYYSVRDSLLDICRPAPPKYGYVPFALMAPGFFDADFRYLDDPKNTLHDPFDRFHRCHIGDNLLLNTGGQAWWRHMDEGNARLTTTRDNYDLYRVRQYLDICYTDLFRVYIEGIYATSVGQDLPPAIIDINKGDILDLFVDLKLCDIDGHGAYVRVGRQEMLFGSQRLISTLDWSNTRRAFQGVRGFRQGDKFDVDLFYVRPVPPLASQLDSADKNLNFYGAWTTYRAKPGYFFDFYYLALENNNRVTQQAIERAPFTVHTLGTRYAGDREGFLWDGEAMLQLGQRGSQEILAGATSAGLGYNFRHAPMNPTVWAYYDWASGDKNPGEGKFNTFNQLFPFGHYYFGWVDQVGRQNIQDLSAYLYLYPTKWLTVNAQYHHFWLAESRDALYNAAGVAIRRSATGSAGNDVGNEVDFIFNVHLDLHSNVLFGYSKLFGGRFLEETGPATNTDLLYVMYNVRW